MATTNIDLRTAEAALAALDELIEQQRKHLWAHARRLRPALTEEEFRSIHAFPEVQADPQFRFEDGKLAGYVVAKMTLKSRLIGGTLLAA